MAKLKRVLIHGLLGDVIGVEIPEKGLVLVQCGRREVAWFVKKYHYSGKIVQGTKFNFKVLKDGKMSGAIQIGHGQNPACNVENLPTPKYEFDRMVLLDELPKFSESILIGALLSILPKMINIKSLVTYADGSVGNSGTIYKATNAKYLGSHDSGFFILPSGERIHPVALWNRHGRGDWEFLQKEYPGIQKAVGQQHKFVYLF
jgi:hypothetical protein